MDDQGSKRWSSRCGGHGQGNTDNGPNFRRWHRIKTSELTNSGCRRSDCGQNTCSPQAALSVWTSWLVPRVWCLAREFDISTELHEGGTLTIDYEIEPYETVVAQTTLLTTPMTATVACPSLVNAGGIIRVTLSLTLI